MITDRMEILTSEELKKALAIDEEVLLGLEEAGLPYVQLPGQKRVYLVSSMKIYFGRIEDRKRGGSWGPPVPGRKVNTG